MSTCFAFSAGQINSSSAAEWARNTLQITVNLPATRRSKSIIRSSSDEGVVTLVAMVISLHNSETSASKADRAPRKQSCKWIISTRAQSPNKSLALREDVPIFCTPVVNSDAIVISLGLRLAIGLLGERRTYLLWYLQLGTWYGTYLPYLRVDT